MKKLTIALVAHDNRKAEMVEWAVHNAEFLSHHHIVFPETLSKSCFEGIKRTGASMCSN